MENNSEQYLVFSWSKKTFGLPILTIKEIVKYSEPMQVPFLPDIVLGLIRIRDRFVSILNMKILSPILSPIISDDSRIVIVEYNNQGRSSEMAIVVDSVFGVIDVISDNINSIESMQLEENLSIGMIKGVCVSGQKSIILLRANKLVSESSFSALDECADKLNEDKV